MFKVRYVETGLLLVPRVEFRVGLFQVRDGETQVTLGGGQGAVAEQILHVPQVRMILDEVSGAGVAPMPLAA